MTEPGATRRPAAALAAFAARVLERVGLPEAEAATVAGLMIDADLSGADSHGIFRLPQYVRRIRAGGINVRPDIRVLRRTAATALVDGDNGMGHLVVARAAELAIELARQAGVGWVGVRNSNHAGAAAVYATLPLRHRMAGVYFAVASSNHMPVWGSRESLLGTNPIAFAIPAGQEPPIVLDMATTVVSYGTVKGRLLRGEPMPEGWMVDREGRPITDPRRAGEGFLLPLGGALAGYKGSGLALVLGLLAGPLNGAAFGRDVVDFNADDRTATNTGQTIIALDIDRFVPLDEFAREVERHIADLRASERLPGVDAISLPGEGRARRIEERSTLGVPMPGALLGQLDRLAADLGVARLGAEG